MSAAKKRGTKAKAAPAKMEYAGNYIVSNFWVKVGFSREELGALAKIAKIIMNKKYQTTGTAARLVLITALMHWDKLWPLAIADQKYAEDEGFTHMEDFRAKTIARKFNLPKTGTAK